MLSPAEPTLYDHDGITLTARHLAVGGATYAVSSIDGVRVADQSLRRLDRRLTTRLRAVVFFPLVFLALLVDYAVLGVGSGWATLAVWVGSAATLYAAWRTLAVRRPHLRHAVVLTVGGREVTAAVYDEPGEPGRLSAAVSAVIGR